jgi:integrase
MAKRKRGSIVHKGGDKWLVRAFRGTAPGGKKLYTSKSITGPYSAAQKALTALHTDLDTGSYVAANTELVEGYIKQWIRGKEIEPRTRRDYTRRMAHDIFPYFGDRKLQSLTPAELREHFQELSRPPRNLGPRTRQYTHQIFTRALKQAVADGLLRTNLMDSVDRPSVKRSAQVKKIMPLTDEQTARLFQATEGTRNHALWLLLATTGARPGEALALEWDKVFLEDEVPYISIEQAVSEDEAGNLEIRATKTAGSVRKVSIPPKTVRALKALKASQGRFMLRKGRRTTLVFCTLRAVVQNPRYIYGQFQKVLKKAGLPKRRLYDLRHTHATWLLENGVNPKVAAERLGHVNTEMFLNVYTHATKQGEDKALQLLSSAFG